MLEMLEGRSTVLVLQSFIAAPFDQKLRLRYTALHWPRFRLPDGNSLATSWSHFNGSLLYASFYGFDFDTEISVGNVQKAVAEYVEHIEATPEYFHHSVSAVVSTNNLSEWRERTKKSTVVSKNSKGFLQVGPGNCGSKNLPEKEKLSLFGWVMDDNSEVYYQNVDNEGVVADCFRNPVVLREIFEHFSRRELLQLSFVNKSWKREAQSLMRKRGQYTAYVKAHYDLFDEDEQADAFISDLIQMNPVPFSGIRIDIDVDCHLPPFPIAALDPLQDVTIDQPALKTVSVRFRGLWSKTKRCPGVLLTKKVLQDCSAVLEELEIEIGVGHKYFMEKVVQDCIFPNLKILKLRERPHGLNEVDYENYVKAMLSRAPNLKILHSSWSARLLLRVLEGSSVLPVYGSLVRAPFEEISQDTISAVTLESMQMYYTGRMFNFERFNRITPLVLQQACTTTLRSMRLDALLAIPLMSYGISLVNVKYLKVGINYDRLEGVEAQILGIVKNFDFTRIFPKLIKVVVIASKYPKQVPNNHINRIIEQANAVLGEPMPDRANNVKTLDLHQWSLSSLAAQFFAEMFPKIEILDLRTPLPTAEPTPFESIWTNWQDLEELQVAAKMLPPSGNLDSVFCGIFPEEVAELRLKDDEYLKTVNIVPVMPAVTCLKNLRTLSLQHEHYYHGPFGNDATFLFSKVTALVAFARRPTLTVSLKVSSPLSDTVRPVMTHLEPYMSITFDF